MSLDHRKLKTPLRNLFLVPSKPLAAAVAQEWQDQQEFIQPTFMHLVCAAHIDTHTHAHTHTHTHTHVHKHTCTQTHTPNAINVTLDKLLCISTNMGKVRQLELTTTAKQCSC